MISLCYWRNCWNICGKIFRKIEGVKTCDDSDRLTREDIDAIVEILASYDEKKWEEEDTYHEREDIKDILCGQCATLMDLRELMAVDPAIEVRFYDSY